MGLLPSPWWSWSGSNRRPPECKSGALPAELQPQNQSRPVGCRGSGSCPLPLQNSSIYSKWRLQDGLTRLSEDSLVVWSGTAVLYSPTLYTQALLAFENSTHVLS